MGLGDKRYSYLGYVCLVILLFIFPLLLGSFTQQAMTEETILKTSHLKLLSKIPQDEAYLYFGYVGCTAQCPKALRVLNDSTNQVATYFISLIPGLEDQQVQDYVDFMGARNVIGVQASNDDLKFIETYFSNFRNGRIGVYNPELHTDQVFLIKKGVNDTWTLTKRYNNSISLKQI